MRISVFCAFPALFLSLAFSQGMGGGMGGGPGGEEGGGGPGGGPSATQTPKSQAEAAVKRVSESMDLSLEARSVLLKYFQRYYEDLVFYGDHINDRLMESLAKQRDQRICRALDSLQCLDYMDIMNRNQEPSAGKGPPPDGGQGRPGMGEEE
ncbi:MAG TPA: hypothetical protein VLM37_02055 [Fibrobacteraceae bacterium]|nr:hypothetical protein [Fibrobacteraceae bacterium]